MHFWCVYFSELIEKLLSADVFSADILNVDTPHALQASEKRGARMGEAAVPYRLHLDVLRFLGIVLGAVPLRNRTQDHLAETGTASCSRRHFHTLSRARPRALGKTVGSQNA